MIRSKRKATYLAALFLIAVVIASSPLLVASEVGGEVSINIKGTGKGYVILSGETHLEGTGEFNGSCTLAANLESNVENGDVMKVRMKYLVNATVPEMFPTTTATASFGTTQPTLESLVMIIEASHETVAGKTTQKARISGYVRLSNDKDIKFNVTLAAEGSANESIVDINATVDIEKGALSEEDLSRLKLMIAFLTPEILNTQLEDANVTWVHINKLSANFSEVDGGGVITATSEILLTRPPANMTFKGMSAEAMEAFTELSKELSKLNSSSSLLLVLNVTRTTGEEGVVYSEGNINYTVEGDLEKVAELIHDFLVKLLKPKPGSGLDELVIMPSNASLKLNLECQNDRARLDLVFDGLKIKHSKLTGPEAENRIASVIVSMVEVCKLGLKPTVKVSTNIEGISNVSTDPAVMKAVVTTLHKASERENLPEPLKKIIAQIEAPETTTTATTTSTPTTTTTTPTTTSTTTATSTTTSPSPLTTTTTTTASPTTTATTTASPTATTAASTTETATTTTTETTPTTTTAPSAGIPTTTVIGVVIAVVVIAGVAAALLRKR